MNEITVTMQQMYDLLIKVDGKVTVLTAEREVEAATLRDHEARIRTIETQEDLSRRVLDVESKLAAVQQRTWAYPSLAGVAAIVALIAAFSDKL